MNDRTSPPLIVVGVDGSEASRAALRWAARQAELTGAQLRPVQAWRLPTTYGMPADYSDTDFEKQTRDNLRRTVEETLGEHPDLPVDPRVVEGHPAAVLTDTAREADLLVVGSHGHGAFAGMLLGSVSHHCVHHATCPVLVVRAGNA
ncbi:universal stress protein [Streptomyces sp. SLBN-31]|uniref:universal stress protein n=1 Tax=Streptomyces sp. SLBN-31 TaxID=2768444 RepID=UPI00116C95ED|nr:universal stress protein [Streptomyces sp. SLBN-31]TQJ91237.1 nucleotide-binding universal stress UspA family protein [Streptomyces sp. SLBN-31]